MPRFEGQHFAILGAGRSGLGAARLARLHGAEVTVFDEADPARIKASLDRLHEADFRTVSGLAAQAFQPKPGQFQQVIISPGLDASWPLPAKFTREGVPLTGEMEFAFNLTDVPLIGITGTNGKSTCTELVAALCQGCGLAAVACGNHGMPLSEVIVSGDHYDVLALEISSFQLETLQHFRAQAAIWLNFAPDHLDRYPDVEAYRAAKARIFENATEQDLAIVRAGESISSGAARRVTFSAFGAEDADYVYRDGRFYHQGLEIGRADGLRLRGRHNMENLLAAMIACHSLGLSFANLLEAAARYVPAAHRCELVREWKEREFINDSKATNLHALEACLMSLERPAVLIAGGKDKQLDYSPLRERLPGRVRALVSIGEIAPQLQALFTDLVPCQTAPDMASAVREAVALSQEGDAVILSPGTSSFDMYSGYAERGEAFRKAVQELV